MEREKGHLGSWQEECIESEKSLRAALLTGKNGHFSCHHWAKKAPGRNGQGLSKKNVIAVQERKPINGASYRSERRRADLPESQFGLKKPDSKYPSTLLARREKTDSERLKRNEGGGSKGAPSVLWRPDLRRLLSWGSAEEVAHLPSNTGRGQGRGRDVGEEELGMEDERKDERWTGNLPDGSGKSGSLGKGG